MAPAKELSLVKDDQALFIRNTSNTIVYAQD